MEATKKRNIRSGVEYDQYFPPADAKVFTVKRNATLSDTIALIPKVVYQTLSHTKAIAQVLKDDSVYATCRNIWQFVYRHIQYKKDKRGYEQIRSPARAWHDRGSGVDCDCYTVFISSILTNLGIPHILRITRYSADFFQHIYPVVPLENGKYITIDCVTNQFDFEVPYSEKKDYPMDLQYLSGFDSEPSLQGGGDGMDELGRIIRRSMAKDKSGAASPMKKRGGLMKRMKATAASNASQPAAESSEPSAPPVKKKKKKFVGKLLNKINKINPATVLLRNGILAAMKLNISSVAKRLRWSYLSQQQAAQHGIDAARFAKLVKVREKLENIFYGAGGKTQNLKKAILGGKGNKDKAVHGLGDTDLYGVDYLNTNTPLEQLLGPDIYHSENVEGMDGFQGLGELGEPVTLTSVGAAMGVITSIVASLKKIGDIFKGNGKGAEDFNEEKTDAAEKDSPVSSGQSATPNQPDAPPAPDKGASDEQPVSRSATQSRFAEKTVTNEQAATSTDSNTGYEQPASSPPAQSRFAARTVTQQSASTDSDSSDQDSTDEDGGTSASTPQPAAQNLQVQKVDAESVTPPSDGSENKKDNTTDDKKSFWQKNKGWIKPVAIGAGGIGLLVLLSKLIGHHKPQNNNSPGPHLSGATGTRKGKRKNYQRSSKSKKQKKSPVALM